MKKLFNPSQHRTVTILRFLYPVWTVIALLSLMYISSELIAPGNLLATSQNIQANAILYNLSIAGSLITQLIHIFIVLLLWHLFKSVNRNLAGLILVLGLVSVPIAMFNTVNIFAAQLAVTNDDFLNGITTLQSQSLMMFFLNLYEKGLLVAQVFWGLWLFPIAFLIYESGYFRKITGHFLIIAGFGYALASFGEIIFPAASSSFIFTIFTIMSMGEILFMLWVVIGGAKLPKE